MVATRVGAVPQMIASPTCGMTVRPNDPAALTGALRTALSRGWDRQEIAAGGQSRGWANGAAAVLGEI